MDEKYRQQYREQLNNLWKENEGYSETPYNDSKGNPTIGYGINLNDEANQRRISSMGYDPSQLTKEQIDALHEATVADKEKEFEALRSETFPTTELAPNERAALMSMYMNSANLIGPNVRQYLNEGNKEAVAREILVNSNKNDLAGKQSRRLREAEVFLGDKFPEYTQKMLPEDRSLVRDNIEKIKNEHERKRMLEQYSNVLGTTPDKYEFKRLMNLTKPLKPQGQ